MNKKRTKLLSDMKAIFSHFKLNLSSVEAVGKSVFALDKTNRKFLIIDADHQSFFKTIDLQNVIGCTILFHFISTKAADVKKKRADDEVEKVELQISHTDPTLSVNICFYDRKENNANELRQLTASARTWRNKINAILPLHHNVAA